MAQIHTTVGRVASKHFISTLSVEQDLDSVLRGSFNNRPLGEHRGRDERFVEMVYEIVESLEQLVTRRFHPGRLGSDCGDDLTCETRLVYLLSRKVGRVATEAVKYSRGIESSLAEQLRREDRDCRGI